MLLVAQIIQVKRRKSGDHQVTSPADEASATSSVNITAESSDELQASTTQPPPPQPVCQNDTEEEDEDQAKSPT